MLPLRNKNIQKNETRPAGTQYQNDVVSSSMRRDHVASTSIRRHFNVVCPLGGDSVLLSLFIYCENVFSGIFIFYFYFYKILRGQHF